MSKSSMINRKEYRYQLDKSSKKFRCPNCGKKTFVLYKDVVEGDYLSNEYGRCDREIKCGYFNMYKPSEKSHENFKPCPEVVELPSFHSFSLVEKGLHENQKNTLIKCLNVKLGKEKTTKIAQNYKLGNAKFWHNAMIFWQIDHFGNVHAGKIIRYNKNGKRFSHPYWVHSYLKHKQKLKSFNLGQCLFGLHLINEDQEKTIAIVESEKTACVMSAIYPENIWLATGSLNGLNKKKLLPIRNRKIILYPDSGISKKGKTPFELWELICMELRMDNFDIHISEVMENETTQKQKMEGYDLADFFI